MAMRRRGVLFGGLASFLLSFLPARARIIAGKLPWHPSAGVPPTPVRPGPWLFFTAAEAAAIEALVDRLIPPDPKTPGVPPEYATTCPGETLCPFETVMLERCP